MVFESPCNRMQSGEIQPPPKKKLCSTCQREKVHGINSYYLRNEEEYFFYYVINITRKHYRIIKIKG